MHNPLIKICGIQEPKQAKYAVQAGAHYIGLIFSAVSKRYVTFKRAQKISTAVYAAGGAPVAVFVDHNAEQMARICLATHIKVIQLHGNISQQQHYLLPEDYQRIYVISVNADGTINKNSDESLIHCRPERDFLLFDSIHPGQGQIFNWNTFKYQGPFRFGIAGGLTINNVQAAIKKINPFIVDVSSGVENSPGKKDIVLIKKFITAVQRSPYENSPGI